MVVRRQEVTRETPNSYESAVLGQIRECIWRRHRWYMDHTDRVETSYSNWFSFVVAYVGGGLRRFLGDPDAEAVRRFAEIPWNFEYLYGRLDREEDRELLSRLVARRALDAESVPLVDVSKERISLRRLERDVARHGGPEVLEDRGWRMPLMNVRPYGLDAKFFANAIVLMYSFVKRQYECPGIGFSAGPGDHVVDAGACYGDTALTFADQVRPNGSVYSFEMVPENLSVMRENLKQNPDLASRVTVFSRPLGARDGVACRINTGRAGASVSTVGSDADVDESEPSVATMSIDALHQRGLLARVDMIKMDIEGAEVEALKGAEQTIRKFRPRLAICIYHSPEDFEAIPRLIDSFGQDYRFALGHYSGSLLETVLYCY
ncbi:FkbM family methyltransferase [Cutibacterium avidum]|uniref:FkbM family methyltransferase n=1 Tax=Cutibacterium avidum TaxID=33010 RepID=UPI00209366BA|nr:FkbM family methyltransferase [Cutibacterium avidum]MCO6679215.1 FkbM family methyltransferase [Cutibacterium avidum]